MKKMYFLMILMSVLALNGFSQNLLLNGGFEEGNDPDENWRPLNWPQVNSEGNAIWVGLVTPEAPEEVAAIEGANCFRIQAHTPGTSGYIVQEFNSPDEDNYEFSFYANFALGTKSELKVEVINKPEDGVDGSWNYVVMDSVSIKPNEWQKFTYKIEYFGDVAKGSKLQVKFSVFVDHNDVDSKIFIDDIKLGVEGSMGTAVRSLAVQKDFIATNPVRDFIRFNTNLKGVNEVSIYSVSGKEVYRSMLSNSEKIDVSHLENGIYFISAKSNTAFHSQKFIKF